MKPPEFDNSVIWDLVYLDDASNIWDQAVPDPKIKEVILEIVSKSNKPNLNILDLGCGNGRNSRIFDEVKNKQISYTGIDFSAKAIMHCKKVYKNKSFFVMDITREMKHYPNFFDKKFDLIIDHGCFHAISPEKRIVYSENIKHLVAKEGNFLMVSWYGNNEDSGIENYIRPPDFVPYGILNEWFVNKVDIIQLFNPEFDILNTFIDKTPPP